MLENKLSRRAFVAAAQSTSRPPESPIRAKTDPIQRLYSIGQPLFNVVDKQNRRDT